MPVSTYSQRSVNLRRFLALALAVGLLIGGGYFLHGQQVKKHSESMLRTAQNMRKLGNLNESLGLYERYLNFRPGDTAVLAEYAETMDEMVKQQPKRQKELIAVYMRIIGGDPKRLDIHRKLIDIYLAYNSHTRAAKQIEDMMRQDPALAKDTVVMEQYGLCAEKLRQFPQAIERYRIAIDSGKASSEVYLRLANLLQSESVSKSSLEESRKLLDRLVQERPNDPAARLARARYFLLLKQSGQAIQELQKAMSSTRDAAKSLELVMLLAELHRQANNLPAVRDTFAQAVEANPTEIRYRLRFADMLAQLGDKPKGVDQLHEAMRHVPLGDDLAVDVIDRMIAFSDLANARAEIDRHYGSKSIPFVDYLNGKLDYAMGDWPAAQTKLSRALPAFDKMPLLRARTQESLGHCARAANNPQRMAAHYAAAVEADPTLASAKLGLAEAYSRLGRTGEATDTFRQFAERSTDARTMLARLVLEEQLSRPSDRRNWNAFDDALGPPPHPPAVENLRVIALRLQNKRDEALTLAKALCERHPDLLAMHIALATMQAEKDAKQGLATLVGVQEKLGDKVELRLAKANILAADRKDAAAIAALAEDISHFGADERGALLTGLANIIARRLDQPAEAVALLRNASEAKPNDLLARALLIDMLITLKKWDEADAAIDALRQVEGAEGPSYLFAHVARRAAVLRPADAAQLPELRTKIRAVLKARPTWGRAALLAAELDDAAGDGDAALEHYRRTFTLGERRPSAVQRLVSLLVARRLFEDARRVLAVAEESVGLNDELRRTGSLLDAVTEKPGPKAEDLVKRTADSKQPADHLFRGQWFLLSNRPKDAVAAYEAALSLDAASADGWLGLIHAQAQSGDTAAAQKSWKKARDSLAKAKLPDPASYPLVLGMGREALADFAGAEQLYKDALQAFPGHPGLLAQLALLYRRVGRTDDASLQFQSLIAANASDSLKRFARRELAWGLVMKSGLSRIPEALKVLDDNAPPTPDDLRKRGLIVSFDPFRRAEARKLLEQAAAMASPSQDDALHLAEFYIRDDDLTKAEEALKDATRGSTGAAIAPLVFLHTVQRKLGRDVHAAETFERVRQAAPGSWEVAVEDARLLAARGDKAAAVKGLQAHPLVKEPAQKLRLLVPVLDEIGCASEAEELLRSLVQSSTVLNRHAALAFFQASHGRGLDALRTALALPDAEYAPPAKARVLYAMILPLPRAAVASFDRDAWDKLMGEATAWADAALSKAPNEPAILTLKGVIADARGQTETAVRTFEKVLAIDPKAETAANSLAYLLVLGSNADPARAESLISNQIALSGPKPALLDTRALARMAQGKDKEAGADIEAALAQMPGKSVYWFRLAQVREKAGEFVNRDQAYQRALRLGLEQNALHPLEWPAFEKLKNSIIQKR